VERDALQHNVWIGRTLVGLGWAPDGKWDWTSDVGDEHSDFVSIAVCRREGYPPLYRLTLGPLSISIVRASEESHT
jgi:hypothetical protein